MQRQAKAPVVTVKGEFEAPTPARAKRKAAKQPKFGDKKEHEYYAERVGQIIDVLTMGTPHPIRGRLLWRDTYNICLQPLETSTRSGNTQPMLVVKTAIVSVQNVEPLPTADPQPAASAE